MTKHKDKHRKAPPPPQPEPQADAPEEKPAEQVDLEALKAKAAERDEFLDRLQRMKADSINFRTRLTKEFESRKQYAVQELAADLLGVLDNLDRAIDETGKGLTDGPAAGLLEGVKLVRQQTLKVLADHGVAPIHAVGERFDPAEHEAVLQQPSDRVEPGTVVTEVQKGYRLHDRVVRPAKVIVAMRPPAVNDEPRDEAPETADPE